MSHAYNPRNNSSSPNTVENESALQTSDLILSFEKKLLSRFDGVDKELLNLKDVIIKNLQSKTNAYDQKLIFLKIRLYILK